MPELDYKYSMQFELETVKSREENKDIGLLIAANALEEAGLKELAYKLRKLL